MEEMPCFAEDTAEHGTTSNKKEASHETFETESTITSNSEHDFHYLRNKLCLLEYSLEQQRATSSYLREERDEAITLNSSLQREVDELRREVHTGKSRFSSELPQRKQSGSHDTGPLKEEQTVVGCIVALPRKCVRGLVKRAALFLWWTGVWANEGLGMLRIENKWVELQQMKCELEQDNARLLQQVYDFQKQLMEKEVEIVREIERNKELTNRLIKKCGASCSRSQPLEKMAKQVHAVTDFSESLSDEIERIKGTMDRRLAQFEKVYQDVDRLSESQRFLEITERNLEKRVKNLADAMTHDCHYSSAECSQVREIEGMDETDKEKVVLPGKTTREKTPAHREESISRIKAVTERTLSSVYGVFCCGVRVASVFLLTFLVTGVLFHFLLVSSSLRLPSSPADEYYGVDLFALWSYFINWLFCLLVTE